MSQDSSNLDLKNEINQGLIDTSAELETKIIALDKELIEIEREGKNLNTEFSIVCELCNNQQKLNQYKPANFFDPSLDYLEKKVEILSDEIDELRFQYREILTDRNNKVSLYRSVNDTLKRYLEK